MVPDRLQITVVGSGTCVPRLDRGGPCVLVRGGGAVAVVDLGLGSLHGLLRAGLSHREVDALFMTHLHPDHTAELASFFFAANYDEVPRTRPLILAGGAGLRAFLDGLGPLYGHWLDPQGYERTVREVAPAQELRVGGLRCGAGAVRHIPSSLAWRFEAGGKAAVITGDTGPCPELESFARGADLLIAEASLAPDGSAPLHLSAAQAGELARRAGVGRLLLTHLYPAADGADPAALASEAFGASAEVARDGLLVEL